MKRFEIFFGIIKVPIDLVMTILAFLAAFELRLITEPIKGFAKPIDYSVLPSSSEYLQFSFFAALSLALIFTLGKMYSLKSTTSFPKEARQTISFTGVWAMFLITYFFFTEIPFSRLATIYSVGLTLIFILCGRGLIRIVQNGFLRAGIGRRRIAFIGNNKVTEQIHKDIKENPSYKVMGHIGAKGKDSNLKNLGPLQKLQKIIKKYQIDEIIQTKSDFSETQNEDILETCDLHHINYRFVPDLIEVRRSNIEINTIGSIPIISLKSTPLDGWGKVLKRAVDITGASLGIIVLSPLFLMTAIAIKLDSKGPILFSKLDDGQPATRIGQHGKAFRFFKFRSMKPNTHWQRYKELAHKDKKSGPIVKIENDPRITRVGHFIRKYSIDELPSLWNVLIGNISLVGPRPHLPEEVAQYQKHHRFVFTIKPGMTGLAQISNREETLDFEKEVKLDRYYIENWSLILDIKIIIRTIGIVLSGHNE